MEEQAYVDTEPNNNGSDHADGYDDAIRGALAVNATYQELSVQVPPAVEDSYDEFAAPANATYQDLSVQVPPAVEDSYDALAAPFKYDANNGGNDVTYEDFDGADGYGNSAC